MGLATGQREMAVTVPMRGTSADLKKTQDTPVVPRQWRGAHGAAPIGCRLGGHGAAPATKEIVFFAKNNKKNNNSQAANGHPKKYNLGVRHSTSG